MLPGITPRAQVGTGSINVDFGINDTDNSFTQGGSPRGHRVSSTERSTEEQRATAIS